MKVGTFDVQAFLTYRVRCDRCGAVLPAAATAGPGDVWPAMQAHKCEATK